MPVSVPSSCVVGAVRLPCALRRGGVGCGLALEIWLYILVWPPLFGACCATVRVFHSSRWCSWAQPPWVGSEIETCPAVVARGLVGSLLPLPPRNAHLIHLLQMQQPVNLGLVPSLCSLIELISAVDFAPFQGREVVPQRLLCEVIFPDWPFNLVPVYEVMVRIVTPLAWRNEFAGSDFGSHDGYRGRF